MGYEDGSVDLCFRCAKEGHRRRWQCPRSSIMVLLWATSRLPFLEECLDCEIDAFGAPSSPDAGLGPHCSSAVTHPQRRQAVRPKLTEPGGSAEHGSLSVVGHAAPHRPLSLLSKNCLGWSLVCSLVSSGLDFIYRFSFLWCPSCGALGRRNPQRMQVKEDDPRVMR